jgi:hypothetical protein
MSAFLGPNHRAVIAILKANATLVARLTEGSGSTSYLKIFDQGGAKASTTFPYITVGLVTENSENTFDKAGAIGMVQITHWTSKAGFTEARELAEMTYALLDNATLNTGSGVHNVYCNYLSSVQIEDEEGAHRYIAATYGIFDQKT